MAALGCGLLLHVDSRAGAVPPAPLNVTFTVAGTGVANDIAIGPGDTPSPPASVAALLVPDTRPSSV